MSAKNKQYVMILERSKSSLNVSKDKNDYILEGVFAEFGKENNNRRIYEEKVYLPHLDYLKEKIKRASLLGELDHPEKFDISLKNVSHVVENLEYIPDKRSVVGRVRLLNTDMGKNAKSLVDDGVQLNISSRAAGVVKEDKTVEIKKIFTYDLVAEPGFQNANLKRINESLGLNPDDENIAIYEMNDFDLENVLEIENIEEEKEKINEKNNSDMEEFVTKDSLQKYSLKIKEQFEEIENKVKVFENEKYNFEKENINLKEELKTIKGYFDYLTEKFNTFIEFSDYIAENVNNSVNYSEYIAEKTNGMLDDFEKYSNYLAENLKNVIGYSSYLAENLDENISENQNTIKYSEYIAEILDNNIKYNEHIAENVSGMQDHSNYIVENLNHIVKYSEHIAKKLNESINYTDYVANTVNENFSNINENKDVKYSNTNKKINSINRSRKLGEKVDEILESVKKQKTDDIKQKYDFPYFNLLSESKKQEFMLLEDNQKQRVIEAVREVKPLNEYQFVEIWNKIMNPQEPEKLVEKIINEIPKELKPVWEKLDENVKQKLLRQAEFYNLKTTYQIKNFWNTRQVLTEKRDLEKINESVDMENEKIKEINKVYGDNYMNSIANGLDKFSLNR